MNVIYKNREKFFKVSATGFSGMYEDAEICHFFTLSNDGITGINPITYNADAISLGISATKFGKEFFENGGNIKAVMESDKIVDQDVFERLKQQVRNNHGTVILEDGVKYKAIGIAPEAAPDVTNEVIFLIQDISRIFNVPPHMLADLSQGQLLDRGAAKYFIRPVFHATYRETVPRRNWNVNYSSTGRITG